MAKLTPKAGTTSKLIRFYAEKADGSGAFVGLVYNSPGLTAYYCREGDAASTAITLNSGGTLGTYASGTLIPLDAVNMPGWYELGLPNAALAAGKSVAIVLRGVANLADVVIEIELTATDNQDAVAGGLTVFGTPLNASLSADLAELMGLLGKNQGLRDAVNSGNLLQSYNLFTYDTVGHATTNDGITGVIHEYHVVNTYDGAGNLLTCVVTRVE